MPRTTRRGRSFRRKLRPSQLIALSIFLVLFLVAGAFFARSVLQTKADLNRSAASATALQQAIAVGDKQAATLSLARLQTSAAAAHLHSNGPMWKATSKVPFVGDDIDSVRVVADVLNQVAINVMPPLVELSTQLDLNTFAPHNGKVDLKALSTLEDPVAQAHSQLYNHNSKLSSIDLGDINGLVRGPVGSFKKKISDATQATSIANDVLGLAPKMLGDKNRTYLFAFQNNAETRSTGGIAGTYLLATVNEGKIKLTDQGSTGPLGNIKPTFKLTSEEKELYSKRMTTFFPDTNLTPEFPRTAEIMKSMVKDKLDVDVDGVVSVDPIAMSYVLVGTGPVTIPDGTVINAQNAVAQLLNKSYLRYPNVADSSKFFDDTAAKLFTVFTDGVGNTGQTVRGLVRASKERRILVWSAHRAEQKKLETMSVAATLSDDTSLQPTLGVYTNDSVGAKLNYYLHPSTSVTSVTCEGFGTQTLAAEVTLRSTVPKNAADLPFSILGASQKDRPGVMRLNLRFYLPTGGSLLSAQIEGTKLGVQTRPHKGHPVFGVPVVLKPGQISKVNIQFRTSPGQLRTIKVAATPSAQAGRHVSVAPSPCKQY